MSARLTIAVDVDDAMALLRLAENIEDVSRNEQMARDHLRAALGAPHYADGPTWMELLAAATDALRHGEHDGPCWPRHWDEEVCELHVSTQHDRYARLAAAVDALEVPMHERFKRHP